MRTMLIHNIQQNMNQALNVQQVQNAAQQAAPNAQAQNVLASQEQASLAEEQVQETHETEDANVQEDGRRRQPFGKKKQKYVNHAEEEELTDSEEPNIFPTSETHFIDFTA